MTVELFNQASTACSKSVTRLYSTSFSSAINLLHADMIAPIHHVYGFVRLADEIVDTFHHQDKSLLLEEFKKEVERKSHGKLKIKIYANGQLGSEREAIEMTQLRRKD